MLAKRKDNAIEFRHRGWWKDEVINLFKENKVGFCSVSGLEMPQEEIATEPSYHRFHGEHYKGKYDDKMIRDTAKNIKENKARKIYAYFNNDEKGYSAQNALELKKKLR
jgi:uncharacterized protein YecE (DUF72 family)